MAAFAVLASAGSAAAARPLHFEIAPGSLRSVVVAIGAQAGITIGVSDPAIANIAVRGLKGRMAVATALARILAGTVADYRQADAETFEIVRRSPRTLVRKPVGSHIPVPEPGAAIVVTGSKRATTLRDYVGSIALVDGSAITPNRLIHGSEALVDQVPILSSTHLGSGRNKLFIRGLADSSFNGRRRRRSASISARSA